MITWQLLTGAAMAGCLDVLATLRLEIFREYPYLYDGRRDNELAYLQTYAQAPDGCVILVHDADAVVGAVTGMPFIHEGVEMLAAFSGSGLAVDDLYYVGELLLFPAYRARRLGVQLLAHLEEHVCSLGRYRRLACVTVARPDDHPCRPEGFVPITRFMARTGFVSLPGVTTHFAWHETDGIRRNHRMQFWIKELS